MYVHIKYIFTYLQLLFHVPTVGTLHLLVFEELAFVGEEALQFQMMVEGQGLQVGLCDAVPYQQNPHQYFPPPPPPHQYHFRESLSSVRIPVVLDPFACTGTVHLQAHLEVEIIWRAMTLIKV